MLIRNGTIKKALYVFRKRRYTAARNGPLDSKLDAPSNVSQSNVENKIMNYNNNILITISAFGEGISF